MLHDTHPKVAPSDRDTKATVESTPVYVFFPLAPFRMKMILPHAKLVVILRDPTERCARARMGMRLEKEAMSTGKNVNFHPRTRYVVVLGVRVRVGVMAEVGTSKEKHIAPYEFSGDNTAVAEKPIGDGPPSSRHASQPTKHQVTCNFSVHESRNTRNATVGVTVHNRGLHVCSRTCVY